MANYLGVNTDIDNPYVLQFQGAGSSTLHAASVFKVAVTPASVNANSTSEQTFTVAGLQVGDFVEVNKPSNQAGLSIGNVRVSAANTLAVQFVNTTAGAIVPAAETYIGMMLRL